MDEYVEKCSPMNFPRIGSPMDDPTLVMGPPINVDERSSDDDDLSDEHREKCPPMNVDEVPSDQDVRGAGRDLLALTECRCDPQDHGGAHHPDCWGPYREDVTLLLRRVGVGYRRLPDGAWAVAGPTAGLPRRGSALGLRPWPDDHG